MSFPERDTENPLPRWTPEAGVPKPAGFWTLVHIPRTPGVCWEWKGATAAGYGRYKNAGRLVGAHRYAWSWVNGEIPAGMVVRHKCDNRRCCNPDHLELGTYRDNARDTAERGRAWWQKA